MILSYIILFSLLSGRRVCGGGGSPRRGRGPATTSGEHENDKPHQCIFHVTIPPPFRFAVCSNIQCKFSRFHCKCLCFSNINFIVS